jgi:dihydrolipoamide dehydrogenase
VESIIRLIDAIQETQPQEKLMPQGPFDADVIVIGAGPGGYVAAIRAAQLGASTIVVEKEHLGGTCLNWGCIPSKAMIAAVGRWHAVKHAGEFGVVVQGEAGFDFAKMMARKDKIVTTQRGGIAALFKKNKVRHVPGFASFLDPNTIEVLHDGKSEKLRARKFILATGSSVLYLDIPGLEGGRDAGVWTSDDAVTAPFVPESMLILGGGAVGCEFSYVFNGLGSKVTLVEMMPSLIPIMDADLGAELGRLLKRQGIDVLTGARLEQCERTASGWKCAVTQGGQTVERTVQVVLLGVGRKANTEGMNLEAVGAKLHSRGVEIVDDTLVTHQPSIYAIGDVTGRIQLAHVASYEGTIAAQNAATDSRRRADYKVVPGVVYTIPEVASVGMTQSEAETRGYDVTVGRFAFRPLGKAMASGEQDGFVKVVAERKYGEVLGVHIVGAHAGDLIHEGAVAIKLEATLDDLVDTIHAHPTMSEAYLEAFEDAAGHAIHKA